MTIEQDDLFATVVDTAIGLGLQQARKSGRTYDVMYFAAAMWSARPFIEAASDETADMRAARKRLDLPPAVFPFAGPPSKKAKKLIEQLKQAVVRGSKAAASQCILDMRALAAEVNVDMPLINSFPHPKVTKN